LPIRIIFSSIIDTLANWEYDIANNRNKINRTSKSIKIAKEEGVTIEFSNIPSYLISGLFLSIFVMIVIRFIRNFISKSIVISATVTDKKESQYIRYTPAPEQITDYILIFKSGGKSLSFTTSFWNYDSVRIGDHGMLEYKGNHLIGFKQK
jgi:hypothetical protein